jgi:predicted nicotinamide N-methyase
VNKQNLSVTDFLQQAQLQTVSLQNDEIEIYLPNSQAIEEAYRRGEIPFPFWSKIWPAAIALSEFLLDYSSLIQNKKLLELGAGLGLPSLVAARYAATVMCTDHAPEAVAFASISAAHNKLLNFSAEIMDWNQLPNAIEAEGILLSDINYEPTAFAALMKLIFQFLEAGKMILLSTPQRLMAKEFIGAVLPYCKQQEERLATQNGTEAMISVLRLQN